MYILTKIISICEIRKPKNNKWRNLSDIPKELPQCEIDSIIVNMYCTNEYVGGTEIWGVILCLEMDLNPFIHIMMACHLMIYIQIWQLYN